VATLTIGASLLVLGLSGGLAGVPPGDIMAWCAAVLAATAFWCGLAAAANLTRWRSAVNAVVLTVAWLLLVIVTPAVLGEIVNTWAPVPSRVQLINAVRTAGNLGSADVASLVSAYYEAHPDAAPSTEAADVTAIRGLAQQDEIDRRIGPILSAYRAAAERQQRLADRWRFMSPPLLVHDAVAELAGTTGPRYQRFAQQVDRYHASWREYFSPLVHAKTSLAVVHYNEAPRFAFEDEPAGAARARALGLLSVTGGVGFLLLALALVRVPALRVSSTAQ
jgi:ABC-2 type transport system permease protein